MVRVDGFLTGLWPYVLRSGCSFRKRPTVVNSNNAFKITVSLSADQYWALTKYAADNHKTTEQMAEVLLRLEGDRHVENAKRTENILMSL